MGESRFHSALKKKVLEEIDGWSHSIANGDMKDFDHYKYSVGYIAGLRASLGLCAEIEQEIST